MAPEKDVLHAVRDYLRLLPGAEDFVAALDLVTGTPEPGASLPVPDVVTAHDWAALASERSLPLVRTMIRHQAQLAWFQPYEGDPRAGEGFAERAAANPCVGPWAPLKADHVGVGFFPVGPKVTYADHAHEPDEIYVPIAGRAHFHCDTYGDLESGPDRVILQPSWAWHRMHTEDAPVLILWVWTGGGFHRNPVFRDADGNPFEIDL